MKNDTVKNIVAYIDARGEVSPKELLDHFPIQYATLFHHLRRLLDKGVIFKVGERPKVLYMIARAKKKPAKEDDPVEIFRENVGRVTNFAAIPILGCADCGQASQIAEQKPEGFLKISKRILPKNHKNIFAIQAKGASMNLAKINGKNIENGDYVLIDSTARAPQNGDCVLSVIDGVANLKKFHADQKNKQVLLVSESTVAHPPICIHPAEVEYLVNGKAVDVIKKIKV